MERGEIDMSTFGASADIEYLHRAGKFAVVSQSGTIKAGNRCHVLLGNTPIMSDLVKGKIKDPLAQKAFDYGEYVSQIGMWLALPPRTPERDCRGLCPGLRRPRSRTPNIRPNSQRSIQNSPVADKAGPGNVDARACESFA